jgi:hypothetical protein
MNLLIFILICYGMTQIIVYGSIFDEYRPSNKFFHCSMCIGFHVGWVVYLLSFLTDFIFLGNFNLIALFFLSCISSGTSYVLCNIFTDEGISIKK